MGYYSLERGGGVCPLRQAFTLLHGGEHTPATTQSGAPPLKRGTKENLPNTYGDDTNKGEHLTTKTRRKNAEVTEPLQFIFLPSAFHSLCALCILRISVVNCTHTNRQSTDKTVSAL